MNVRNGAATVREAVESVLAQSFADWELIVWDDCSMDNSAGIVQEYRDPRIRYFLSPEDTPLGPARDAAVGKATGEWLAFLDQDDIWLPDKLGKQMALANAPDIGMIYGRTVRFYPNGRERDYDQAHEFSYLPEGDIFRDLFTDSCFIAMSSAVIRRSAFAAVGGIPDEAKFIPDYYLYVAVARQYRVKAVQEVVCRYRMHAGNMSQRSSQEVQFEALALVDRWAQYLDPPILKLCHRRHATAIALDEMRHWNTFVGGMRRLVTQGSIGSQLARPFWFLFHIVRRNVRNPYWRVIGRKAQL